MTILDSLNALSKALLGVGIVDIWKQTPQTKATAQKAAKLAQEKHLREAAKMVEKTLATWSTKPGLWERLLTLLLLGDLLKQLNEQLRQWKSQLVEVDQLIAQAKAIQSRDRGNPIDTQGLSQAVTLYERCSQIIYDEEILDAIDQSQLELQRRYSFQNFVQEAALKAETRFFKLAIAAYREAERLYPTEAVIGAITTCSAQIPNEEAYTAVLSRAKQAVKEGRLRGAISLLESALTHFPRSDGIELLEQLQRIVQGREKFRAGLAAEQRRCFQEAVSLYAAASLLLPDPTLSKIRLGLIAIKTQQWGVALSYLESLSGEQAAYLRGFAHAQQGNLQQAYREWESLSGAVMEAQREILKTLSQRQRLMLIQNIEQLVKDGNLQAAKTASMALLRNFESDGLVEANLEHHIRPRLEASLWQGADWETLARLGERIWISQPDIVSLHNWMVATYYRAQNDLAETPKSQSVQDWIIALSTALANLPQDPALQDVPWLGNTPVNLKSLFSELKRQLEAAIDTFKDQDINEYLQLRDCYRLEAVALHLMSEQLTGGMKVQDVFVTPGCYQRYFSQWRKCFSNAVDFHLHNWNSPKGELAEALYTPWGLAVAACLEGDSARAIQLKPTTKPTGRVESFAQKFVAYHEGYYWLQQLRWREAVNPLQLAQSEIYASLAWQEELDRLCGIQRHSLSDFDESLEFAQFWYNLLGSQPARNYLAEYKAEQTREKLANERISPEQALRELQEIQLIDEHNPVVLDLLTRVELNLELEEINQLFKQHQLEEMVRRARQSRHDRVRYIVADFFIDILVSGIERGDLKDYKMIQKLGRWAYEICPNEPAFQEIYRSLRLV